MELVSIQIFLQTQGIGVLEKNRERFKIGKVVGVIVQPGNGSDTLVVKRQLELNVLVSFLNDLCYGASITGCAYGFLPIQRDKDILYATIKGKADLLGAVKEMELMTQRRVI